MDVGIIGGGWIVERAYLPLLTSNEAIQRVHIYDSNADRVCYLQNKYVLCARDSVKDLLESDVTCIIVATPNNTHSEYTNMALSSRRHVLCEKPVAISVCDYQVSLERMSTTGRILMPAFVNRFRPDTAYLQGLVQSGFIGKINCVNGKWIRRNGIPRPGSWITNRSLAGGGVISDLGPHIIDICLSFTSNQSFDIVSAKARFPESKDTHAADWYGTRHSEKYLQQDVEISAEICAMASDSTELKVELSWNSNTLEDYTQFVIEGEKGTLELRTLFGFSGNTSMKEITLTTDGQVYKRWPYLVDYSYQAFQSMLTYFFNITKGLPYGSLTAHCGLPVTKIIEDAYRQCST